MINGVATIPISGGPISADAEWAERDSSPATLAGFLVGPENRLVEVAIDAVLDSGPPLYNPVLLYGPAGSGKSHLVRGLVALGEPRDRQRPPRYVTAVDFARQLADANDTHTVDDFRARYCETALLALEDLEHLAGKQAAQRELLFTIDSLLDAGSRIVLTACAAPCELAGFLPRLHARLLAGLLVPLALPGTATRLALVERISRLQGMELPCDAAQLLAEGLPVSVPEVRGAMVQLDLAARLDGRPVDATAVRRLLAARQTKTPPSLRAIALMAAKHFSLKLSEMRSASRRRGIVTARGVAMYVARNLTGKSLDEIGDYFGGRDHTTVSHGCRMTEERLKTEPAVRQAVAELQEKLSS